MENKKCRICDIEKPTDRFRRNGKICRKCANVRNEKNRLKWINDNREVANIRTQEWKEKTNYKKSDSYKENKVKQRRKGIEKLSRSYVYTVLYSKGFKPEYINEELIKLQTIILKTKRLCKTSQN